MSHFELMDYDPHEPLLSIGLAAKKLGISPETLRLYEKEGLLITHKTKTGRRLYSQEDLEWVSSFREQITKNRLNIAGIRMLLALIPCWDLKPCSEEERKNCAAYMNSQVLCWTLDEPGYQACQEDSCRDCVVYHETCRVGKLEHMYVSADDSLEN